MCQKANFHGPWALGPWEAHGRSAASYDFSVGAGPAPLSGSRALIGLACAGSSSNLRSHLPLPILHVAGGQVCLCRRSQCRQAAAATRALLLRARVARETVREVSGIRSGAGKTIHPNRVRYVGARGPNNRLYKCSSIHHSNSLPPKPFLRPIDKTFEWHKLGGVS